MTNRSKRLGSGWERDVCEFLRPIFPTAERSPQWGALDKGDLTGTGIFTVECKNTKAINLAQFIEEARTEAFNVGPEQLGVAIIKRRGKGVAEGYAVMRLEDWRKLAAIAGVTTTEPGLSSP